MKVPGCYSAKVMSSGATASTAGSLSKSKLIARSSVPRAVILHGTTCSYQNESITFHKRDINTILIGRYMVERAGFQSGFSNDEYYVAHCSALVLEVCLTCKISLERFIDSVFKTLCFLRWMRFGFLRNGTAWCSRGLCSKWV